jgi:hypothetical protein
MRPVQREYFKKFRETHPEYYGARKRCPRAKEDKRRTQARGFLKRDLRRIEIITKYSNGLMCCNQCGYSNVKALVLDHVNDDGYLFRMKNGGRPMSVFDQVERAESKGEQITERLQVLCANCNVLKEVERKLRKRLDNPYYRGISGI